MWMKKCEGFTSPNQKHMWSAAVCVCFKGPTLSVTQPVFQRLASDSGKQRERTEKNTVTFSASHRLHPVLPKVCLFSSNSSIFSGSCSSIVSLSPFYRVTPFLTSMAGHVARRLWWPEARSLLAGHGSEGSRVCVCVCVREEGRDSFFRFWSRVCTHARWVGPFASSITRGDISTTKRLQSNRPINLISARICQSKERGRE